LLNLPTFLFSVQNAQGMFFFSAPSLRLVLPFFFDPIALLTAFLFLSSVRCSPPVVPFPPHCPLQFYPLGGWFPSPPPPSQFFGSSYPGSLGDTRPWFFKFYCVVAFCPPLLASSFLPTFPVPSFTACYFSLPLSFPTSWAVATAAIPLQIYPLSEISAWYSARLCRMVFPFLVLFAAPPSTLIPRLVAPVSPTRKGFFSLTPFSPPSTSGCNFPPSSSPFPTSLK